MSAKRALERRLVTMTPNKGEGVRSCNKNFAKCSAFTVAFVLCVYFMAFERLSAYFHFKPDLDF